MTENKAQKSAIRQRMAATGEPYSVARHEVEREHDPATGAAPAGPSTKTPEATSSTTSSRQRPPGSGPNRRWNGPIGPETGPSEQESGPNGPGNGSSTRTRPP